jgi:DNA-directed RNA polymerase specialized sigma24 family protein
MMAFYLRVRDGKYPDLNDRQGLWKLLISITLNKARALARKESRRLEILESEFWGKNFKKGDPSPEFAIEMNEQLEVLLGILGDQMLQRIAVAKLDGYTNAEIASQFCKSVPTIERKLRLIRQIWANEWEEEGKPIV